MSAQKIKINGILEPWRPVTISALLGGRGIAPTARGVAVACNGAVVPRSSWNETFVAEGDEIEIIKAISGG